MDASLFYFSQRFSFEPLQTTEHPVLPRPLFPHVVSLGCRVMRGACPRLAGKNGDASLCL
jgi:hypothetical protein